MWLTVYQASLDVKPSRRFYSFEDIESGLSAALSSTLGEFEHYCRTILLQLPQVTGTAERGDLLQQLSRRTHRCFEISTACDAESFGSSQIARQHVNVLERLAKHYEDTGTDAFEAPELRLEASGLRDRYNLPPDGFEIDEVAIFHSMSVRASNAFDTMKPRILDRHFANLFSTVSPAFPPAHVALCFDRPQAAKALLIQTRDQCLSTDILKRRISHLAAEFGDVNLLQKPTAEARDIFNMTQLAVAANTGDLELFENLVQCGHSLDARDVEGRSILCIAAGAGSTEIVKYMLERKVNPNPYSLEGGQYFPSTYTALHAAAAGGHIDVVKVLLNHKAIARWVSHDCTPSQEAFKHGHEAVGKLLKEVEAVENRHLEEAGRTNAMAMTPVSTPHVLVPSHINVATPQLERAQSQKPSETTGGRFASPNPWSRKRTHADSEAHTTPA
ncbi:uncharacterized protein HMPREF1541_03953 [Cyphellophora europaea CBS 101466]|uniref:Uncharacterized protein n=1 Tax=Cyphellophora europaea (strain CBS 101466) TaxID=1220924 RepID=W2S234_CYPE1|nr:uncharacterized protein HMPREF1541_03953 [Cyphellophora europaea CBS 101466]ETN42014.1 hypothetical protein HMPREF1541_03953 [Cyphellophora europaea CBS 101466]